MTADQPVVVVLGAGIGGRGVALALAGAAHVVVVDRDQTLADAVAGAVAGAGGSAEGTTVDLLELDAVNAFRDDLLARHGRVDAVIHMVGGWRGSKTVDEQALADWDALEPALVGTIRTTTTAFRETLAGAPSGRYVMVTSRATENPTAGNAAYASAKAAAETWVRALGHAFRETPARALIVAVMALVDDATREKNPDKDYSRFTDTRDLGAAIAGLLTDATVVNGARIPGPTLRLRSGTDALRLRSGTGPDSATSEPS